MKPALLLLFFSMACAGQSRPTFEVASVKPSGVAASQGMTVSMQAGRLSYRNMSLYFLIRTSYRLRILQMETVPTWTKSERFDVEAQAEDVEAAPDTMMRMLQTLLEDRFRLSFHREVRDVSGYALTVDDRGPKLSAAREGRGTSNLGNLDLPNPRCRTFAAF